MALTKISTGGVKDDAASQAKIADEAVDEARLQVSNAGSNGQFLSKQSGNTGGLTWADASISSSAQENTLVGTDTGSSFTGTDAYYNSLFGYRAGGGITTGDGNTLMGRYAGYNTTTGGYNTSYGTNAGRTITTGSNNTCLGWRAGFTNLTTGSNNTLLGHMATASSASVSNEVTVGDTNITKFRVPALSFTIDSTGVADSKGNLRSVPRNAQSSAYTLVASDAGKHIYANNAPTITVPADVFASGDVITIINASTSNMTISRASGVSLYLPGGADANRTLGQYGICTLLHSVSNVFWITGAELS